MTTSAELTAQVGVAVDELKIAKERFENIREDTESRVADAELKLNTLVTSDFQDNVNSAKKIKIFIDPVEGNDTKDGLTLENSIKSSDRLNELVMNVLFDNVEIAIRKGTEFLLMHKIKANHVLTVSSWTGSDGSTNPVIFKQGKSKLSSLTAPDVFLRDTDVFTYAAATNEVLPEIYDDRDFFGENTRVQCFFSELNVIDNQLFHIHSDGSGDNFSRRSMSLFQTKLCALSSEAGVVGTQKKVFTWFSSPDALALDFFARSLTVELNGHHANFKAFLDMPDTNLSTNLNLDIV